MLESSMNQLGSCLTEVAPPGGGAKPQSQTQPTQLITCCCCRATHAGCSDLYSHYVFVFIRLYLLLVCNN